MYAYTTRVTLHPGQGAEGPRRWRAVMLPWLREQPGFRRLLVLHADDSNRGLAILCWDAASDWEAARSGFAAQAAAHLHALIDWDSAHDEEGFRVALDEG